jgi:hypothetical protein
LLKYNFSGSCDPYSLESTISYFYSASGNKLKKTNNGSNPTYYQGSLLKINDNPVVLNPERRAIWNSSTSKWEYEYDVKEILIPIFKNIINLLTKANERSQ